MPYPKAMAADSTERRLTAPQFHAVLEDMQDALFVTDPSGAVMYMNPAAKRLYGLEHDGPSGETLNLQKHVKDAFEVRTLAGDPVADDDQPLMRALRGEAYKDVELLVQRAGNEDPRVFVFSGNRIEGNPPLSVLTIRDETDRWRAERRYRIAFEADPAPSVIARLANMRIVQANEGMAELMGRDKDALTDLSLVDLRPIHQPDDLEDASERLRTGDRIHKVKTPLLAADGREVNVLVSARAIEIDGEACGIFTFIDITELESALRDHQEARDLLSTTLRRHADEKDLMARLAITDPLTRIQNRRGLDIRLSDEFSRADRYGSTFSILLLDLDHFKIVNDVYGHDAGDAALREVAELLQAECREPDFAGRWGGEEFMMVLPQSGSAAALSVASRVRELVEKMEIPGIDELTSSIGVASFEAGDDTASLFARADRALYAAKRKGRNRVEVAPARHDGR